MDFKVIGLVGDSIANGYRDVNGGYFNHLQKKLNEAYPLMFGFNSMAQDGDRVCDVYHRLGFEILSHNIDILLIAVGVNDIIRPYQPDAAFDMSEHLRCEYWTKLLSLAKTNIKKVMVIGMLPVREDCYPDQDWADLPIYTFNQDIEDYNRLIEQKCRELGVVFYNPYPQFRNINLGELYQDACHPNREGHQLLAEMIEVFLLEKKVI